MKDIKNFEQLIGDLSERGIRKRVAVVCPWDKSTREAVKKAAELGFADPVFFEEADPMEAARKAIALIREGGADILMKGLINSDILLRAILDKEEGILEPGHVLTHIGCAGIPDYPRLLFYTDAAVIPYPTQEQRVEQVRYLAVLCRAFGIERPRISLIHCSEKVDGRHFPFTAGYADIIRKAERGEFGECLVDGPLDLKTSCSPESLAVKSLSSPVGGEADALVFPDIEAANLFHKVITLFARSSVACVLQGTQVPVVMPSRADSQDTKFYSIALAAMRADTPKI